MTMDRGNLINKKKRGREGGNQVRVHVDHMDQKRTEMMTNSTSKKPRYPWDQEFGCLETWNVNYCSRFQIYDHHHYHHEEEEEDEEEKGKVVGVFDFPWLKEEGEGVIFKGGHHEYLFLQGTGTGTGTEMEMEMGIGIQVDHQGEDTFALYSSCLPADDTTTNSTPSTTSSPALHHDHAHALTSSSALKIPPTLHDNDNDHHSKSEDNNLRLNSFQVDHADIKTSVDQHVMEYCIWSSVLDQPLDVNLNIL